MHEDDRCTVRRAGNTIHGNTFLKGCDASYTVRMDRLIAFMNHEYYVRCSLSVSEYSSIPEKPDPIEFLMNDTSVCKVRNWQLCSPQSSIRDGDCGCSYSSIPLEPTESASYRFFYYLKTMNASYDAVTFTCQIETFVDFQEMNVVKFVKHYNGGSIYNCSKSDVQFNWDFEPRTKTVKTYLQIMRTEWISKSITDDIDKLIAVYNYVDHSSSTDSEGFMLINDGMALRKLRVLNISDQYAGNMKIRLFFNASNLSDQLQKVAAPPSCKYRTSQSPFSRPPFVPTGTGAIVNVHSGIAFYQDLLEIKPVSCFMSTLGAILNNMDADHKEPLGPFKPLSQPIKSEHHKLYGRRRLLEWSDSDTKSLNRNNTTREYVEPPLPDMLEDSVNLFIAKPPTAMIVRFTGLQTIIGTTILTCVNKGDFIGEPAVNTTLWKNEDILYTRQAVRTLRYSVPTANEKFNYSCGMEGIAMICSQPSSLSCKRFYLKSTDVTVLSLGEDSIDLIVIMYAVEASSCVLLMLWTFSLMLDHLLLIVKGKRGGVLREEKKVFKEFEQRKSIYDELVVKRKNSLAALKERRKSLKLPTAIKK